MFTDGTALDSTEHIRGFLSACEGNPFIIATPGIFHQEPSPVSFGNEVCSDYLGNSSRTERVQMLCYQCLIPAARGAF